MIRSKSLFLLFFFTLSISASINKAPSDTREYGTFTLKNGIEVVTVSDKNLATSAATLSVGVGQFQDPDDAQGIAHYLEHMIFMGSKKYKKPNEYMQFISENGGSTNAFTATEQTTYLFSINSDKFEAGLDRLSAAIKAPIFDPSMVEKEISAVNSEWLLARQTDQFVTQRTAAMTGNPDHPKTNLGVGNKDTLSDDREQLLESLKDFYNKYYSANLMKLVLVGNQSPRELKSLARKYFEGIKNKKVERPLTKEKAYLSSNLLKNIFIKKRAGSPSLSLEFPIRDNSSKWKSKPNSFVEKLLNSQEENTLMSYLVDEGFIESGNASIQSKVWGYDGSAFIDYILTEKGVENKNLILDLTFEYLNLIQSDGIIKEYFDEIKAINERNFIDFSAPRALAVAVGFGSQIFDVPVENLIDYSYLTEEYDEQAIKDLMSQLKPEFVRIYHLSTEENADIELKYADGSYRTEPIPAEDISRWKTGIASLKLPEPMIILLDEPNENVIASSDYEIPQKVYFNEGVQAYLSQSINHKNNKGLMSINMMSPIFSNTAEIDAAMGIIFYHFIKSNRRILQKAYQGGGVSILPNPDNYGNIGFFMAGRSMRQIGYANDLISKLMEFEIKDWEFKNAKEIILDQLESIEEDDISSQLFVHDALINKTQKWTTKENIEATKKITYEDVQRIYQEFTNSIFLDIYAYGNYDPSEVVNFAKSARNIIGDTSQKIHWRDIPDFSVKTGTARMKKVSISKDGVGLLDNYVYPVKSEEISIQLNLINRLMRPTFFNELRTLQEVGYIASSFDSETNEYPTLSMLIVSDNTNLKDLKEKVMGFIYSFVVAFDQLPDSTIENTKKALLDEMNKIPENLGIEASQYFADWGEGNYSFDTKQKAKEYLENTTKQDLTNLINDFFIQGNYMNTTVQIKGDDFSESPWFSWQ